MTELTPSGKRLLTSAWLFVDSFRTMYYACRSDYPCEGCEQPRVMAARNALAWAWRTR